MPPLPENVDTVLVVVPDMQGRLMGKRVTAGYFRDEVAKRGMHACAYLLTVDVEMEPLPGFKLASWDSGYQDVHVVPDFATMRPVPWLEKTAVVIGDVDAPVAPRTILKRQIERAKAAGFTVMVASELEFYLFRETYESARAKNHHDLAPGSPYLIDYHILHTTRDEPVIREIRNGMDAAGIPVESSKGEWGKGQHEINLRYAEALEMADRHVLYKNGAKEIAAKHGVSITFMAKFDARWAGSSFHLHSSVWKGKRNVTSPAWLAGLMAHARECSLFFAPTVNSYKRYQAASFAPTRIAWARDNRTVGFRTLEGRVENRLPGADGNPYLAFAATIAAGLDGIERKLEPPPEFHGDAYASDLPKVPLTLAEATAEFESSAFAREAFGAEVVEHYAHAARMEQAAYERAVTCWERERYFERI